MNGSHDLFDVFFCFIGTEDVKATKISFEYAWGNN